MAAIASETGRSTFEGLTLVKWGTRRGTTEGILPAAVRAEADLIRGAAAAQAALKLQAEGWNPALIVGHPGWGETTYMREIFPEARQIAYAEYYYRSRGGDVGFDPEFSPPREKDPHELYGKNAGMAMAFAEADAIVSPTPFQASLLPEVFRQRTHIIHEGVDTSVIKRHPTPKLTMGNGKVIDGSRPLVRAARRLPAALTYRESPRTVSRWWSRRPRRWCGRPRSRRTTCPRRPGPGRAGPTGGTCRP